MGAGVGTSLLSLQADGTWTDIPRCIEHDPGVDEQKTGDLHIIVYFHSIVSGIQ